MDEINNLYAKLKSLQHDDGTLQWGDKNSTQALVRCLDAAVALYDLDRHQSDNLVKYVRDYVHKFIDIKTIYDMYNIKYGVYLAKREEVNELYTEFQKDFANSYVIFPKSKHQVKNCRIALIGWADDLGDWHHDSNYCARILSPNGETVEIHSGIPLCTRQMIYNNRGMFLKVDKTY